MRNRRTARPRRCRIAIPWSTDEIEIRGSTVYTVYGYRPRWLPTVQYCTVQYEYSTVQYSTPVQYSTVLYRYKIMMSLL
jgi:hypothetical protein